MGLSLKAMLKESVLKPALRIQRGDMAFRYPEFIEKDFAERIGLVEIMRSQYPPCEIKNAARRERYQLLFSPMSVRRSAVSEKIHAQKGLAYADPWSDRRLAELVIAMPQHIVHRFADFKRLPRKALSDVLPLHLAMQSDILAKANPTPFYRYGVYEREVAKVRRLISTSKAASLGMVSRERLSDYYEKVLCGGPERYDLWWFITLEIWLSKYF
jgi:asparagine synthase (glutamine-hydrolysing)